MKMKDVARRARVSVATVGRVLKGIGPVKRSTRKRVLKAIEDLKYHPNLLARSLSSGNASAVGVVVPSLGNPFFLDIVNRIESRLRASGQDVIGIGTNYQPGRLIAGVRMLIGHRVTGLVILVSEMDPEVMELLDSYGAPSVVLNGGNVTGNSACISIDYQGGTERTIRYLRDLGHRRMAFIGDHAALGSNSLRRRAFEETIAGFGPCVQCRTVLCPESLDGGREATRELFAVGFRPTAIVCHNDYMAIGALRELRERGLSIPRDISVTGFDNIPLTEFCEPPLTTVHVPRDEIATFSASWLNRKKQLSPGRSVVIHPELIVRESTCQPATA
jgi:DNA-binding LacI/PurR family transcriptional regulator